MKYNNRASLPLTVCIVLTLLVSTASAKNVYIHSTAVTDIRSSELRASDLPSTFAVRKYKVYTKYVKYMALPSPADTPPPITALTWKQGLSGYVGDRLGIETLQEYAYLATSSAVARAAFLYLTQHTLSGFKPMKVRIGDESATIDLVVGMVIHTVVFRRANVLVMLHFTGSGKRALSASRVANLARGVNSRMK